MLLKRKRFVKSLIMILLSVLLMFTIFNQVLADSEGMSDLHISNIIVNDDGDEISSVDDFEVTIKLNNTLYNGIAFFNNEEVNITDGSYRISGGDSLIIKDLPSGTSYSILLAENEYYSYDQSIDNYEGLMDGSDIFLQFRLIMKQQEITPFADNLPPEPREILPRGSVVITKVSTPYLIPEDQGSDERIKENIEFLEVQNGLNIYVFNYIWDNPSVRYVGVIAQEIIGSHPDAVSIGEDGFYRVDYNQLGISMVTYEDWLEFGNQKIFGYYGGNPVDSDTSQYDVLEGVVFNLEKGAWDTVNHMYVYNVIAEGLTTDANGQIRIDNLEPGPYRLIETKLPAGHTYYYSYNGFYIFEGHTEGQYLTILNWKGSTVDIEAQKVLAGRELIDGEFTFELLDEQRTVIARTVNDVDGKIIFKDIPFTHQGTRKFIIREVKSDQEGITYDEQEFKVEVITRIATNYDYYQYFESEINYVDGEIIFENNYVASKTEIPDNPETSEESTNIKLPNTGNLTNIANLIGMLLISQGGLLLLLRKKNKRIK